MECRVYKLEVTPKDCTYGITLDPGWKIMGKRIYGFERCKFDVYYEGQLQYILEQTSVMRQAIAKVVGPLLFLIPCIGENPFSFYRNGVCRGRSRTLTRPLGRGKWEFHFDSDAYQFALGRHMLHTLSKNGSLIAIYQHHVEGYRYDAGYYTVTYTLEAEARPDILLLFAAFCENYIAMG